MLHVILLIIFLLMGVFGLIFNIPVGVFVATALVPWEVRMIFASRGLLKTRLIQISIVIAALVGVSYFLINRLWSRALIVLGIQAYVYFVHIRDKKRLENAKT